MSVFPAVAGELFPWALGLMWVSVVVLSCCPWFPVCFLVPRFFGPCLCCRRLVLVGVVALLVRLRRRTGSLALTVAR